MSSRSHRVTISFDVRQAGLCLGFLTVCVLLLTLTPSASYSQGDVRYFPETKHNVRGRFLQYWNEHGGLAQQGYPLTEEFQEKNKLNGQMYTVQYFERSIFEMHPENQPPFDVLLSHLGRFELQGRYPNNSNPAAAPINPDGGAQQPTPPAQPPAAYNLGPVRELAVTAPTEPDADAHFEIPFWVVPDESRQINISTHDSYSCWIDKNPLTDSFKIGLDQCSAVSVQPIWKGNANPPAWARNYDGLFTQHVLRVGSGEQIVGIRAGENKNERRQAGAECYRNTVNSKVSCQDDVSGYDDNGAYHDGWKAYNGFINMSWQIHDAEHNWGVTTRNDEGPIIWPANGYTNNEGSKTSVGLRHPHGFVDGGYIWVFYQDTSNGQDERGVGIKVARAATTTGARPGSWQTYCNGTWVDSLPAGFNRASIDHFYSQQGGCATSILPVSGDQISFAVAKVKDGGYLGVEERNVDSPRQWELRLWGSSDLLHWTLVRTLVSKPGDWNNGDLHYPVFLSADGWRSDLLDANNFYLLATHGGVLRVLPIERLPAP